MPQRIAILRELGLTPAWRERTPAPRGSVQATDDRSVAVENSPATVAEAARELSRDQCIASATWDELTHSIAQCTACKLHRTRHRTVPGVGDRAPTWMIVGEGPGEQEDQRGEPFVGAAGRLLDAMLAAIGKRRGHGVYITNVVKCRPPGNRNPEAEEIAACAPYLRRQIALAQPKLLLAVGKTAAQTLLNRDATVGALRGSTAQYETTPVQVTYHPSYLLRTPIDKAKAWADLLRALDIAP